MNRVETGVLVASISGALLVELLELGSWLEGGESYLAYFLLIMYSIILFNIQLAYSVRGFYRPYWLVPLIIAVQYFLSIVIGADLARFALMALTYPLLSRGRVYEPGVEGALYNYALLPIPAAVVLAYMHLGYASFIILGPLWEYIVVKNFSGDDGLASVSLSALAASLIYLPTSVVFTLYSLSSVVLKNYLDRKTISYVLPLDGVLRIAIVAWAGGYAV